MGMIEKVCFYLALFFMGLILFLTGFSTNGIRDYHQLTLKKDAVLSRINIARQENRKIEKQILRLQQDPEYIRHLAKHEHGMSESGELIFKQEK